MVSVTGWWMVSESGDSQGDSVQSMPPPTPPPPTPGCTVLTVVPFDDDVGLNVLGCWADTLFRDIVPLPVSWRLVHQ